MKIGAIGVKEGMTRVIDQETMAMTSVTVVRVEPMTVVRVKSQDIDGYSSVQCAWGQVKATRLTLARRGVFRSAGLEPALVTKEFRPRGAIEGFDVGSEIGAEQFEAGDKVKVRGTSKGRGFSGAIRRWNFQRQDMTHGNSVSHRALGSTGQCQTPGRVWKGKKMPGRYGGETSTKLGVKVIGTMLDEHIVLIKGGVPGPNGARVIMTFAGVRV